MQNMSEAESDSPNQCPGENAPQAVPSVSKTSAERAQLYREKKKTSTEENNLQVRGNVTKEERTVLRIESADEGQTHRNLPRISVSVGSTLMDTATINSASHSSQGYVFGDGFLNIARKSPKTPAQRAREYRARKKKRLAQQKGLEGNRPSTSTVSAENDYRLLPPANTSISESMEHNLYDFGMEKTPNYLPAQLVGESSKAYTNHSEDQKEYSAKWPSCNSSNVNNRIVTKPSQSFGGSPQTDSDLSNSSIHIKEETAEGSEQSPPRRGIKRGVSDDAEDCLVKSSRVLFDEDDDILFFKSLLPHVKKIPDARKLTFRSRVQELVNHFAYES